jgi:hypothetical protein
VVEGREEETIAEFDRTLTTEQAQRTLEQQRRKVEIAEVRAVLDTLQQQREVAEVRRMMPAYVRRFFELAAPRVGVGVRGSIEEVFSLDPCPQSVRRALAAYPQAIRDRLTFERDLAAPGWGSVPG